jgi:SAM-dependent methyltransferase
VNTDLISYYHDRAAEYEKVYAKPERQADIARLTDILQHIFSRKQVLEIACGTGFWTERIAKVARNVLATDLNESVIQIAKQKNYSLANVAFEVCDLYDIRSNRKNESLFGGFIWSHIKLEELDRFIDVVNQQVQSQGVVVFIDNMYVEGSNQPPREKDDNGNTYQERQLENGTRHLVLKNFPTAEFIKEKLAGKGTDVQFIALEYFWIVSYTVLVE